MSRGGELSPTVKLEIMDVEKVKGLSNYYVSASACNHNFIPFYSMVFVCLFVCCCFCFVFFQAYIIKVLCKDGSIYHIYRRYSQFDEMQNALEKRFPIEAGTISAKDRVLPRLPG